MLLAAAMAGTAAPSAAEDVRVLVLHTYGHDGVARSPFDAAFSRATREADGVKVDLYIETLDPNRFAGEAHAQRVRAYLRAKYADKPLSVVVAGYDEALAFLLDARDPLFPSVPIAALLVRAPDALPERVAVLQSGISIGESAALALRLHPTARRIALVNGAPRSPGTDAFQAEILRQIAAAAPGVPITPLVDRSFEDVLAGVKALPPDAIILYVRQYIGPRGEPIGQDEAVRLIAQVARAPIYVTTDYQIGTGAVGGIVISIEAQARELAALALRIASPRPASHVPPARGVHVPMFDSRALRQWHIDESHLPPGSVVRFREATVWDRYKAYIFVAGAILGLQSALIAGLVVQGARRRRTELALRDSEQDLRRSLAQNHDLAGRLIRAQEEERTRIARDLHDDLSQQLAGLSMMLSGLKRRVTTPGAEPEVRRTVATLQERTSALAKSVRSLSHELHPSVLQHTGLVATLRRHCEEVAQQHRVPVTFAADGDLERLAPDVALGLFRVAQEALTNAVRHAQPSTIRVRLEHGADGVDLRVDDDGVGFVAGKVDGRGLGLRSIDERVRLVRGRVDVDTEPGRGTTVRVRIPHSVAPVITSGDMTARAQAAV